MIDFKIDLYSLGVKWIWTSSPIPGASVPFLSNLIEKKGVDGGKIWTLWGFVDALTTLTLVIFNFPVSNPENLAIFGSISINPFVPIVSNLSF